MNVLRSPRMNALAAVVFLLAAVVNSHAFRLGAPQQAGPVDLAQYTLPDGTVPGFCLTPEDDGTPGNGSIHCGFCRLIAMPGLPGGPADTVGAPAFAVPVAYGAPSCGPRGQRTLHRAHARGPPVSVPS